MPGRPICVVLLAVACCQSVKAEDDLGVDAPPDFEVSLYADDELAHDIFSMTIDARGRVVVAGLDYVKILEDTNADGRADRAKVFSTKPASGAHGMYFDGPDLICTGDDSVMRLRDRNGDDRADGEPEVWTRLRHPEHGANGVVRGPDGWYWVIGGNDAGISKKQVTRPGSPVKDPHCGGVLRISPDGKNMEVFADGFRNPYDLDFNAAGRVFTVDSDGERDHHLPWYTPTRLFDIAQGMEHGWLLSGWTRSWSRPESFFDNVDRVCELGRGSPTGVVVYRHRRFPEKYRGAVLSACWTMGKIYALPLEPQGATYRSKPETLVSTRGDVGFAPCDIAVAPDGDLMVAIGGRRTRGSVFRVHYKGSKSSVTTDNGDALTQVLAADQPLASWSRAGWVPLAKQLGRKPFEDAVSNNRRSLVERVRAVEVLVEVFGGLPSRLTAKADELGPELAARLAWAVSLLSAPSLDEIQMLCRLTTSTRPSLARAGWEALAVLPSLPDGTKPDWRRALAGSDRRVRAAAIAAAKGTLGGSHEQYRRLAVKSGQASLAERMAFLRAGLPRGTRGLDEDELETCFAGLRATNPWMRLEAVRMLQIVAGDLRTQPDQAEVFSGYSGIPSARPSAHDRVLISGKVAAVLPTHIADVDRELARLLGMLAVEDRAVVETVASMLDDQNSAEDDIHYVIVLGLIPGERTPAATARTARTLVNLHRKLEERGEQPAQNWPLRVGEAFEALCSHDPKLAAATVDDPAFGRHEHTFLVALLHGADRQRGARKLLEIAQNREDGFTSELIDVVAELPPAEVIPVLREQWEDYGLRDAVLMALAREPQPEDRERFVDGLASPQPQVAEKAVEALARLKNKATPAEIAAAIQSLKQASSARVPTPLPGKVSELLTHWTGQNPQAAKVNSDPQALVDVWLRWFSAKYPHEAAELARSTAQDAASWQERLPKVDWDAGDIDRGKIVFERKACHRCHRASGQLGPELAGAVKRMSREDLLIAIVDPNKEVSPTFQTTLIATKSGQVYNGLVVYESPESTLLKTSPDTTVRIGLSERAAMRPSRQSLMPTGLLAGITDQELADLFAYLKTLDK